MSFAEKMQAIMDLENEVRQMANTLKRQLIEAVESQSPSGTIICDGKNGKPAIVAVRFSALSASDNWTPACYIPGEQARAIAKAMDRCTSARSICLTVGNVIQQGRVSMSANRGDYIYLNNQTIELLRSSELGQFILSESQKEEA